MSQSREKASTTSSDVQFNADVDVQAELQEMKRQVDSLQQDLQLKALQQNAAKDEGVRKTNSANSASSAGVVGSNSNFVSSNASSSSNANAVGNSSNSNSATSAVTKPNTSVFVGNLDSRTTQNDLRVFFASCGTIQRITVLKDRFSGQPKGTAYVQFATAQQAQSAVVKDGQSLHGKPLKVAPKRDNIPAFQRGLGRGANNMMMYGRGRGNFAAGTAGVNAGNPMQQQMAALAMMATMMGGAPTYSPYGPPRGRGRGRGRGTH